MRNGHASETDKLLADIARCYAAAGECVPPPFFWRFERRAARLTPGQRSALLELEQRRANAVNEPCAGLECGRRALPSLARAGALERSTLFPWSGNGRRRKLYRLTAFGVELARSLRAVQRRERAAPCACEYDDGARVYSCERHRGGL